MATPINLLSEIEQCTHCSHKLPFPAKPIIQFTERSKILIAGHAPGIKAHESGIAFNDASGVRLREWLGVSESEFYDADNFAILPMGFCYPGRGKSGDLPPRPECAEKWRESVLAALNNVQLIIVLGQHAIKYHLPDEKGNLTDTVKNWQTHWPNVLPLPHPSPRNNIWLKRNVWFEQDVLPALKHQIRQVLKG